MVRQPSGCIGSTCVVMSIVIILYHFFCVLHVNSLLSSLLSHLTEQVDTEDTDVFSLRDLDLDAVSTLLFDRSLSTPFEQHIARFTDK